MMWIIHIIIVLMVTTSKSFADYGDLKYDDDSVALEFDAGNGDWIPICRNGFDDNAGDVACRQLGHERSSQLSTYEVLSSPSFSTVCKIHCNGDEDRITDCDIDIFTCDCFHVVGVTCTNGWTVAATIAIVCIVLFVIGFITCLICLTVFIVRRRNKHSRNPYRVVIQQAPQVVHMRAATTIATTNNTTYDQVPPAYTPDSGYQPYPAEAPSPAEDPNH